MDIAHGGYSGIFPAFIKNRNVTMKMPNVTDNGRPDDGGKALEEEEEAKGAGELVKAEKVDQNHAGQPDIRATSHTEHSAVDSLKTGREKHN